MYALISPDFKRVVRTARPKNRFLGGSVEVDSLTCDQSGSHVSTLEGRGCRSDSNALGCPSHAEFLSTSPADDPDAGKKVFESEFIEQRLQYKDP